MANRRKLENAALALSVFGVILMVPPLLSIFNIPIKLFGAPLVVIYLFSLWLVLIGATFFLSSRLKSPNENNSFRTEITKENKNLKSKD